MKQISPKEQLEIFEFSSSFGLLHRKISFSFAIKRESALFAVWLSVRSDDLIDVDLDVCVSISHGRSTFILCARYFFGALRCSPAGLRTTLQ